jgi:hypothetical protein
MMFKSLIYAALVLAIGSAHAQGMSMHRDAAGNLPRDNGIAAQNAPRPMTNNAIRTSAAPTYFVVGRLRPSSIHIRRTSRISSRS